MFVNILFVIPRQGEVCSSVGWPFLSGLKSSDAVFISCLSFWVGVCKQTKQRHVMIDQRQEYFANGYFLRDCVAL